MSNQPSVAWRAALVLAVSVGLSVPLSGQDSWSLREEFRTDAFPSAWRFQAATPGEDDFVDLVPAVVEHAPGAPEAVTWVDPLALEDDGSYASHLVVGVAGHAVEIPDDMVWLQPSVEKDGRVAPRDVVISWTAPRAGKAIVSGRTEHSVPDRSACARSVSSDGMQWTTLHEREILLTNWTDAGSLFSRGTTFARIAEVEAGDTIRLRLSPLASDACDIGFLRLNVRLEQSFLRNVVFRVEPRDPPLEATAVTDDRVIYDVELHRDEVSPVTADVILQSALEPCVFDAELCDGGERFVRDENGTRVYGCGDGTDNDGDGLIDFDDPDCNGVVSWSLPVLVDSCFHLGRATTEGSIAALDFQPGGVRDSRGASFERTEIVDPARNRGGEGVVSSVILSLDGAVVLPPVGEFVVLRVEGTLHGQDFVPSPEIPRCDPAELPPVPPCRLSILRRPQLGILGSDGRVVAELGYRDPQRELSVEPGVVSAGLRVRLVGESPLRPRAAFRVDAVSPPSTTQLDAEGGRHHEFYAPGSEDLVRVALDVVLASAFEPCFSEPHLCSGGERVVEDPGGNLRDGCADGIDNDGDGLTDREDPECLGVSGWSLALLLEQCFGLTSATTESTAAARASTPSALRAGGFERTEILSGIGPNGEHGIVSTVVLPETAQVTLAPVSEEVVLRLAGDVAATALDETGSGPLCSLTLLPAGDGLPAADGVVTTGAFAAGDAFAPQVCAASVRLRRPLLRPEEPVALLLDVLSPVAGERSSGPSGAVWRRTVKALEAEPTEVTVGVFLTTRLEPCVSGSASCDGGERFVSIDPFGGRHYGCGDGEDNDGDGLTDLDDLDCLGIQGWSFSVEVDYCAFPLWVTSRGTAADLDLRPSGLRDSEGGSFEKSEIAWEDYRQGFVSAVVLSFTNNVILPPVADSLVLRFGVELAMELDPGEESRPCRLGVVPSHQEGLYGSGEPVQTATTIAGETVDPEAGVLDLVFVGGEAPPDPLPPFVRGDANDDGRADIADVVWIVSELFRQGPLARCPDAADVNRDRLVDVSDASYLLVYQFLGGPAPPAPFPGCGTFAARIGHCAAAPIACPP